MNLLVFIAHVPDTETKTKTVNDKGETTTITTVAKSGLTGLREPVRERTDAVSEALRLAIANATIIGASDSNHRMYGCLYGVEKFEDNPVAFVPGTVSSIAAAQKIASALFLFLFGLAVRNMLKMK